MEQMMVTKPAVDAPLPYVLVEPERLDLTVEQVAPLKLSFASSVWDSELFLVLDLYSASNPVHPQGHVGWWKWPLEIKGDLTAEISKSQDGFKVTFDGESPQEFWKNPDFIGVDEPVIAVHVVLRPVISEAVRFDDIVHLYNSSAALTAASERRAEMESPEKPFPSTVWYVWPREAIVHLVATNAFERDAVGNFMFNLYGLLRGNGIPSQMYAGNFDPTLRGTIRHTCELFAAAAEEDVIFVNFSIFDPWLPRVAELTAKKVFYFHNITPPRFLQVYDAEYASHCANAIAQLKYLGDFHAFMANSASSARILQDVAAEARAKKIPPERAFGPSPGPFEEASRLLGKAVQELALRSQPALEITVNPPIVGLRAWDEIEAESIDLPARGTLLLYVGRVAPHKKIEDLIALFDHYHTINPDSAFLVVGDNAFDGYIGFLRYLLDNEYARLKPFIHFHGSVSDGQLKTLYARSSAFITMSEHEGFCIPVVEAMAFDKPVFAFADEAVKETLGRTGRLFYTKDFPAIAADLHAVLTTPWVHRMMIAHQRQRVLEIGEQATGRNFWSVLQKVIFDASAV